MSFISGWLSGVMAAALISAAAMAITPDGGVKKALRLICGLVMTFAVLSPFVNFDFVNFARYSAEYRNEAEERAAELRVENERLMKSIIETETSAYILDKAAAMGANNAEVAVTAVYSKGEEYPYPWSVAITGDCTSEQKTKLSLIIEGDLGIPKERQKWYGA